MNEIGQENPRSAIHSPLSNRRGTLRRAIASAILALGAAWAGAFRDGFHTPQVPAELLVGLQVVQLALLALSISCLNEAGALRTRAGLGLAWAQAMLPPRFRRELRAAVPPTGLDAFILVILPLCSVACAALGFSRAALFLLDAASLLAALLAVARLGVHLLRRVNAPQLLLPATFAILIAFGACLLKLPRSAGYEEVGWIDALFTATSAVCVTGLAVRSTAEGFSVAGQSVIALLIELGGLGIVVFGATFAALLRGTLSLREHVTVRDLLEHHSVYDLRRFAIRVVAATLIIQLIGALLMTPLWQFPEGSSPGFARRLGLSLFHSISAFCNAGFDITGDSLVPYRRSPLSLVVIATLIILGGIGFPVLFDVARRCAAGLRHRLLRRGSAPARLQLHTRLTIRTTLVLLLGGAAMLFIAQLDRPTRDASGGFFGRAGDAWFMSLTARTAGFNTVPMDELTPASSLALVALMAVGGSPGSMAGGLKTTTLAVLFLATVATLRGRNETEAAGRSIPENLVRKAGAIALCMLALVVCSTFALCITDSRHPPFALLFEAVSAATTTGLSLGITPQLSTPGKLVLVLTMFLGRVGPLTLIGVLLIRRPPVRAYLFPRETVTLG